MTTLAERVRAALNEMPEASPSSLARACGIKPAAVAPRSCGPRPADGKRGNKRVLVMLDEPGIDTARALGVAAGAPADRAVSVGIRIALERAALK